MSIPAVARCPLTVRFLPFTAAWAPEAQQVITLIENNMLYRL